MPRAGSELTCFTQARLCLKARWNMPRILQRVKLLPLCSAKSPDLPIWEVYSPTDYITLSVEPSFSQ